MDKMTAKQKRHKSSKKEKCYDPNDPTLRFVDGDDDMDFLCEDYKSRRALMSCGHSVTPMSLTNWCRYLLDKGESSFVCGQTGCNAVWPFDEVCKMALLTPEEIHYFEDTLFHRVAKDYLDVKSCPGCKSSVIRTELDNLRVCCTICSADKDRTYEFCWQCLKEWRRPSQCTDRCANDGCFNKSLEVLRTCPGAVFRDVKGVAGCPSVRACPTCGFLVEHNKAFCKSLVCPRCKVKFCFVCLKLFEDCLKSSPPYDPCSTGVAPRQTSIPVWRK
ncbi:probable E3 ubiquitin-protein ligase ARI7 [Mugil cephalus]|uniref:probable E3 ubiquitin-protein ligase ARI7 n=1 Tax=Mugil cephalus TaxID=48193 RepID=UPI001FB6785C|nr:probable E3 ubiquitin-protein ligase ARI7 [Mugil cephalus]XP_047456876.1 probable E3 ubiquitin-protein ligase ARI7 [Mugil cephalus]